MLTARKRKVLFRIALGAAIVALITAAAIAWVVREEVRKMRSDAAAVWEDEIIALERDTHLRAGAALFVGSSSIRFWSTLEDDMHPLATVRRGFGGARVHDVLHYADRLFAGPAPSSIVLFVGTNDIRPEEHADPLSLSADVKTLVERIHAMQPGVVVHYILITPTPRRFDVWPIADEFNAAVIKAASADPLWQIIDARAAFVGTDGRPKQDLFMIDGVHLNAAGYAIWTKAVRAHLAQTPGAL